MVISTNGLLFVIFVCLLISKLAGWITISWWLVFLPLLITFAIATTIGMVVLFVFVIAVLFNTRSRW